MSGWIAFSLPFLDGVGVDGIGLRVLGVLFGLIGIEYPLTLFEMEELATGWSSGARHGSVESSDRVCMPCESESEDDMAGLDEGGMPCARRAKLNVLMMESYSNKASQR